MRQVVLPGRGRCEVVEQDEPQGGPGHVVVDVAVSVLSPGTERAILLDRPTAGSRFPEFPGYMAAGTVRSGPGLAAGTRVAVRRARHADVAVVPPRCVRTLPDGVRPADAAVWQLALTALHGIEAGGCPGEPVTVVGQGLLGVITRRLAVALGAPRVRAVAASAARTWSTRSEPFTVFEEPGRLEGGTPSSWTPPTPAPAWPSPSPRPRTAGGWYCWDRRGPNRPTFRSSNSTTAGSTCAAPMSPG